MFRKRMICLGLALGCVGSSMQAEAKVEAKEPVQHEFVIKNFKTESGIVLPEAKIVYGTYGNLDTAGDNAVLLPSHYMAEMHGYGWLIVGSRRGRRSIRRNCF
jgi:homoserine O-acetyltransferase